jgi:hypothetical protein
MGTITVAVLLAVALVAAPACDAAPAAASANDTIRASLKGRTPAMDFSNMLYLRLSAKLRIVITDATRK